MATHDQSECEQEEADWPSQECEPAEQAGRDAPTDSATLGRSAQNEKRERGEEDEERLGQRGEGVRCGRRSPPTTSKAGCVLVENAEEGSKDFDYDPAGNKEFESTWSDATTVRFEVRFEYDNAGRLKKRTEPLDRVTEYEYDGVGNVTSETLTNETDPGFAPRITRSDYDALNRRIKVTREHESGRVETFFKFDGEGNKVYEKDPLAPRHDPPLRRLEPVDRNT